MPISFDLGPSDYLTLSPSSDLFGTSNLAYPILLNGGVLIFRNTEWARAMCWRWWYNRCGVKDQLSLWHTLFEFWSAEASLDYTPSLFDSYASARPQVLPRIVNEALSSVVNASRHSRENPWDCARDELCSNQGHKGDSRP